MEEQLNFLSQALSVIAFQLSNRQEVSKVPSKSPEKDKEKVQKKMQ